MMLSHNLHKKPVDASLMPAYPDYVPEKEGTGIGVLQLQGAKPSNIDGFFFAQRIGFSPMEGRVRGQQCPLVTCGQHANLTRSSTPIGVGMVDFQINHKEHSMANSARTSAPIPTTFKAGALSVDQLFQTAFYNGRTPRSTEYQTGTRAALAFRIERKDIDPPYQAGTAAADAYFAGLAEGHALWRTAMAKIGGVA
ncbi:hypothetical protein [Janthinobacterium sp. PAMC25594]|uniref:hypothetical protein n=1 Tax=Janthinobacterium sp. PAMC25594 TaxID=2861284 RepID=UPI001C631685|nr:hypothetical protein [Janthinobacterium sp. PAMC25594]QYG05768.1 hypothetical protein KY494_21015 [Janthinobacterium sp. PAMC25594]